MILDSEKIKYKISGLNLKKFLTKLRVAHIELLEFERLDFFQFYCTIYKRNRKDFLNIASKFNYLVDEKKLSFILKTLRVVKNNLVFFITAVAIICALFVGSNFVFKIEIEGLENVHKTEVISVLSQNGFSVGKLKNEYDLTSVERVLCLNIDKVSFASAVIKGNTLVVNVDEKIDNSDYVYNYAPIIAPFDCVINFIELYSGTANFTSGQTAKRGDIIVSPFIFYKNLTKLPVPARAKINAYVELTASQKYDQSDYHNNFQKYIEEKQKELYNLLEDKYDKGSFESAVFENAEGEKVLLTVVLKGNICL